VRVLWTSHLIPYPPKSGVHLRSFHLLRGVAAQHEVELLAFIQEPWLRIFYESREQGLAECERALREICCSVRFLSIDSLARPGGKWRTALAGLLSPPCYTLRWLQSRASRTVLANVARGGRFALAHFDTIGLAPYRSLLGPVPATLGHHNVESHTLLRRAENERHVLKRAYFAQEGRRVQNYEARVAGRFAAHITCSDLDSERLRAIAPQANAVTIPNGVDTDYFQPRGGESTIPAIIFVGSLNWYPNVEAVLFLLREIWPALKARVPALRLHIVGSAPPRAVLEAASDHRDVTVHGFVADVRPYLDAASVYVCPIRDGGGTKLKLLDAFAMRKCVVAHPVACEGIDAIPGRHVEHAQTAEEFVRSIVRLLEQPAEREAMGRAARELVISGYSFAQIGRRLAEVFSALGREGHSGLRSTRAAGITDGLPGDHALAPEVAQHRQERCDVSQQEVVGRTKQSEFPLPSLQQKSNDPGGNQGELSQQQQQVQKAVKGEDRVGCDGREPEQG
jgi:sugar transferase (PEP-CTERM/EpsH1 system associated)